MSQSTHTREPAHPTPFTYVRVAFILAAITGAEVGLFYVDMAPAAFVASFFVLSATKFALVALFYMHLRYDARLFSGLFVGGLLLAMTVLVSVLAIFGTLLNNPARLAREAQAAVPATPTPTPTASASPTPTATPRPPKDVYAGLCGACHTITGFTSGTIGPTHDGLATTAAGRVDGMSAEEYIRKSIEDPGAFIVPGFAPAMPPLGGSMTGAELEGLVAFLLTLE